MLDNESNNLPDFKQSQYPGDIDSNAIKKIHYARRRRSVPQGKSGGGPVYKSEPVGTSIVDQGPILQENFWLATKFTNAHVS